MANEKSMADRRVSLMAGTRKGAFIYHGNGERSEWSVEGPHFLGHIIHHLVLDPRDRETMLMASKTGHLGPTIFRSTDVGRTWHEVEQPPAFPKAQTGRACARCRTYVLAQPRPSERARDLVRGHLPAGIVP
jgi:hypothetical protein